MLKMSEIITVEMSAVATKSGIILTVPRNMGVRGWDLVGQTKGYTCKRGAGKGTDDWSGKRVWDTENLRPKLVFVKRYDSPCL